MHIMEWKWISFTNNLIINISMHWLTYYCVMSLSNNFTKKYNNVSSHHHRSCVWHLTDLQVIVVQFIHSQHWFRWLSTIRQQAITWANVDPIRCNCHMKSLGQSSEPPYKPIVIPHQKIINRVCHLKILTLDLMCENWYGLIPLWKSQTPHSNFSDFDPRPL